MNAARAPTPAAAGLPGDTLRLLQLCGAYFVAYIGTGIAAKWFTGGLREPSLGAIAFLFDNTLGSSLMCVAAVLALGWLRLPAPQTRRWLGMTVPRETPFIVVSGICTAVIIPATTLLLTLPVSILVAMTIMRASVIVISRGVDAVLARRGLLRRPVRAEENWAVVFALVALSLQLLIVPFSGPLGRAFPKLGEALGTTSLQGGFEFLRDPLAVSVLGAYVLAYAVRLYWMNVFKLTRPAGPSLDNRGYFAIEQITASGTLAIVAVLLIAATRTFGWSDSRLVELAHEAERPNLSAVGSGLWFALVAFSSVFLFMFRGRTATFAGLVNRITSLLAGTAATLILALLFHQRPPGLTDWIALGFALIAASLLARVELDRARAAGAVEPVAPPAAPPLEAALGSRAAGGGP